MYSFANFSILVGLRGIVTDAEPLLKDLDVIHELHLHGLLVFTYGSSKYFQIDSINISAHFIFHVPPFSSNVAETVDIQKRAGVDAVITDKITKVLSFVRFPISRDSTYNIYI